jgi:hypothetical protein
MGTLHVLDAKAHLDTMLDDLANLLSGALLVIFIDPTAQMRGINHALLWHISVMIAKSNTTGS